MPEIGTIMENETPLVYFGNPKIPPNSGISYHHLYSMNVKTNYKLLCKYAIIDLKLLLKYNNSQLIKYPLDIDRLFISSIIVENNRTPI